MGATIISSGNSAPIFESSEHVFNFIPAFIQGFVISDRPFSSFPGWNTQRDAFESQAVSKPVSIIAAVRQHVFGRRQLIEKLVLPSSRLPDRPSGT